MSYRLNRLDPNEVIYGYTIGVFPMADSANGKIYWYEPEIRAVIPIYDYKPPRSLKPILNKNPFEIKINTRFEDVIRGCAAPRSYDNQTWISEDIIRCYCELHYSGFAHSVEAYFEGELVGGLYGVSIGGAFFGESMFYTKANASKVAFHFLIEILKENNYLLLDSQFMNDNVKRYGAIEMSKENYLLALNHALSIDCYFIF